MPIKTLLLHHENDVGFAVGLRKQLVTKERKGDIAFLPPFLPGEVIDWENKIKESDLILYFISGDSIADELLGDSLLSKSVARASAGLAVLVPIYSRPFDWSETELCHFMAASAAKPLSKYDAIDDGCFEVTEVLKKVIDDFVSHIHTQKQNFEQKRNLINSFNFHEQINDITRRQVQAAQGWCKVCLLQGDEKSGFNLLAWRIRTELAGLPKNVPTTIRAISLNDSREQGPEGLRFSICQSLLAIPAQSVVELAQLLRQHLKNQHFVLYLNHLTLLDTQSVAEFFAELSTAWAASKGDANTPEPAHSLWCFLTYTGETDIEVPLGTSVHQVQFPMVKPVQATDFDQWMNCCIMDPAKKNELLNKQAFILGNAPDNQVMPVLERLCNRLSMRTMLYEEYILKLDNGLNS